MRKSGKLVVVAATAAAVAGLGGGMAMANSAPQTTARPVVNNEPTSPDTDTLQQGDQTTPDTAGQKAATAVHPAAVHGVTAHRAATGTQADPPGDENPNETENANDGPGGHEDPPGDVQHEGGPGEP
jgi:hypothetical protein